MDTDRPKKPDGGSFPDPLCALENKMSQPYPKKYLFAQISAPIVGCAGFALLLGTLRHFSSLTDFNSGSIILKTAFLIIVLFVSVMGSMLLWGRILIMLGILSKEEAKGYPYSKPWESENTK